MSPKLSYDADANAAYLRLSREPVVESEEVQPAIILDFDAAGHIVAVEFIDARRHLHPGSLTEAAT